MSEKYTGVAIVPPRTFEPRSDRICGLTFDEAEFCTIFADDRTVVARVSIAEFLGMIEDYRNRRGVE